LSKRGIVWWGMVVLLVVGLGVIYFTKDNKETLKTNPLPEKISQESPQEGFLAPQFALSDLSGKMVSLRDLRGKVILLNFWASWCGPCRAEIPALERLYQKRKDRGFEIMAVNTERSSASQIASFAQKFGMSFPILLNPQGDMGNNYWVRAIPTSFLVDKKGVIRWKIVGGREWDNPSILNTIDQLLGE
jgi:cytochrome c biogenesis protein CcmG/thiol:disulfide interchange protein DsbE